MIELSITRTFRPYGPNYTYSVYDESTKYFKDAKEAKTWLKDEFGTCKKSPMFVDYKNGSTVKIGYVYSYKNKYENGYEQAWVRGFKLTPFPL